MDTEKECDSDPLDVLINLLWDNGNHVTKRKVIA